MIEAQNHTPIQLSMTSGEAVRRIARAFLDEAAAAAVRLDDPDDAESLHDFRVAIRRTRATFRAWRDALAPEITRAHTKSLVAVQRATGNGRDAEVMLGWVESQTPSLDESELPGQRWLAERLARRKAKAYARARDDVRVVFGTVGAELHGQLSMLTRTVAIDAPTDPGTYAGELADAVEAAMKTVVDRLRPAATDDTPERLHKARIDTKRLRYLVEPATELVDSASALVKACKKLQDVLGLFQDASVLEEEVGRRLRRVAKKTGGETLLPGLKAIDRLNTERAAALFAEVRTAWLAGGKLDALEARVARFAAELRAPAEPDVPVEIERKYLLNGLPPFAVETGKVKGLDQGYLPGERLIERVRRIETAAGERFVRTVKAGKGVTRIELEEDCDAKVFEALWALTEGCRVTKTRYVVAAGDLAWEIDAFSDRELFLAEIELPTEDTEVVFPEWLAPFVDREVTEDGSYTNRRLAR